MGLCALEAEVAGALEGEFAVVAFDEVAVVLGGIESSMRSPLATWNVA